jgi:hypothetical protein
LAIGFDAFPLPDLEGAIVGDGRGAVLVFKAFEIDFDFHTDLDFGHVGEFGLRDETLGLAVDVDDDILVATDFRNGGLDDRVCFERAEIRIGEQFFHEAHCILTVCPGRRRGRFQGLVVGFGFPSGDSTGRCQRAERRSERTC